VIGGIQNDLARFHRHACTSAVDLTGRPINGIILARPTPVKTPGIGGREGALADNPPTLRDPAFFAIMDAMSDTTPSRPRRRKRYQLAIDWLYAHVLPGLLAGVLRALCATLRWDIRGREHMAPFWDAGSPVIVGCWHGRLLLIPWAWEKSGKGEVFVLMGRNRNGELITRIVSHFNMQPVRGGSSSGGEEARREMVALVGRSPRTTLAMTPDGPRGPRYTSKMGMAHLSRSTGAPVVWMSAAASRGWRFPSWDRFLLPAPFARVIVDFTPAIDPRDHEDLALEAWKELLDREGRRQLARLDRELGVLIDEDAPLLEASPASA
jgi:lysophospholipid acyltransferase (LPLAT)-like uncharacterized protein